jgi:hypothetical protein
MLEAKDLVARTCGFLPDINKIFNIYYYIKIIILYMAKVIILNENQFSEMMAYHGAGADFDKFNHKKYLNTGAGSQCFGWGTYVTDDKEVANGYVEAAKGNGERDFFLNLNPKPYLESLMKYDEEMINDILEAYKHYIVATFRDSMKKTYENAMNVINGMIEWEENNLNIYLPVDKVIKMYNEDPRFSNMSDDEKNKAIEDHKMHYEKKERPVKIFKACADILVHFKPEMDEFLKNRFAYLYEVEIPDDDGFNYISWYDDLTNEQLSIIRSKMDEFSKRYNKVDFNNFTEYSQGFARPNGGNSVYVSLEYAFYIAGIDKQNSAKAASLFLMQCGFDGIKYPSGTKWQKPDGASEDAYNYVIFDANKVKIINKTKI